MNEQTNTTQEEMRPCEGCGGMTKRNEIQSECWNCEEGYVESDDWQDWDHPFKRCSNCLGVGSIDLHIFYCSQDCYDASSQDF